MCRLIPAPGRHGNREAEQPANFIHPRFSLTGLVWRMVRRVFILCVLLVALALPGLGHAALPPAFGVEGAPSILQGGDILLAQRNARNGQRRDHDRARDAVGAGDVLPLQAIMRRISGSYPGRLLDANLGKNRKGRWIYRLKLLAPGDQVRRLVVDAQSGRVLSGG